MGLADTTVTIYFGVGAVGNEFFTLDDTTFGLLDGSYGLAGDIGSDVSDDLRAVDIRRGRTRLLDDFNAGTCTLVLDNWDRTYDPVNTSSAYYGNLRPGKRVTVATDGVTIFDGFIEDWDLTFDPSPGGGASVAVVTCVDALASLAAMEFNEWTTTGGQTPGARITDVLNRGEVGWGPTRDVDTGVSTLQGDLVTWGSNVLNYLQLVSRSDLGRLFASRSGVVTFRDRHSTLNAAAEVLFSDRESSEVLTDEYGVPLTDEFGEVLTSDELDGVPVTPESIAVDHGSELLYNRVSVDREGGTAQTVNDTDSQSTPPDGVGVRSLSIGGLLLNSDSQSLDMAQFLLGTLSSPIERISEVSVDVHNTEEGRRGAVLALDVADVVDVLWSPHSVAPAYDRPCVVEGTSHTIRFGSHLMAVALSNAEQGSPLILDDTVLGLLDGPGRLSF